MRRIAILIIVVVLLAPGVTANVFSDGVLVHPSLVDQNGPSMASSDAMGTNVVWLEDGYVWASNTMDGGVFSEPVLVSNGSASLPKSDSDAVLAVTWVNASDGSLMLSVSDDGVTFVADRVSDGPVQFHDVACDGEQIHVLVVKDGGARWGTYGPGGIVWSSVHEDDVLFPSMDARNGTVAVAWHSLTEQGNRVGVRVVSDNDSEVMWVPGSTTVLDFYPDISVDGIAVVAFERRFGDTSWTYVSFMGEGSMGMPIKVSTDDWTHAAKPSVDVRGDSIDIVYDGRSGPDSNVVFSYWVGDGFSDGIVVDSKLMDSRVTLSRVGDMPAVAYVSSSAPHEVEVSTMQDRPPTCSILTPVTGDECSLDLTVSGIADDSGEIELRTEVRLVSEQCTSPWVNASGTTSWDVVIDTQFVPNGEYCIEAVTFDRSYRSEIVSVTVDVHNDVVMLPDLTVLDTDVSPVEVLLGESVNVSATLGNEGPVAADGVTYILSVDGTVVSSGDVGTIGPNGSVVVSTDLVLDPGTHTVRAEVDPGHVILQSDTSDDVLSDMVVIDRRWIAAWVNITSESIPNGTVDGETVNVTVSLENGSEASLNGTLTFAVDGVNVSSVRFVLGPGTSSATFVWDAIAGVHGLNTTFVVDDGIHALEGDTSLLVEVGIPQTDDGSPPFDWVPVIAVAAVVAIAAIVVWRYGR